MDTSPVHREQRRSLPLRERVVDTGRPPDEREVAIVVERPESTAETCYIGALDATVADVNPDYPATDPVVTIAFLDDLDTWAADWMMIPAEFLADELAMVDEITLYTYPRSRLAALVDC